ncbi:hypothetical protein RB195_000199 [Necator americanus]|uniref:Uncharacterized protein n=1 Tax=Necator americanus TaxID=51031 RepID=A0ABR1D9B2_NECAM
MPSKENTTKNMDLNHVEFATLHDREYGIPYYDQPAAPVHSLTSLSGSANEHFLDEIALLKRGKITRDTPKHTYRRYSAETTGPNAGPDDTEQGPITMAELNSRGLMLTKGRIIYNIPHGTLLGAKKQSTERSSDNFSSTASSTGTKESFSFSNGSQNLSSISSLGEETGATSKEFHVGNPEENAKLKISTLKDGMSYRLSIMDDICLLRKTSKDTMLLCWKNR